MDAHSEALLQQFREICGSLDTMEKVVNKALHDLVKENGIYVTAIESRVKAEKSLAGKLDLKGYKYNKITDITDLLGARVITFYPDEVDKIAAIVENTFNIDWENSVDKRKYVDTDRFGYKSLHFICSIPKDMYCDEAHPEINEIRFEVQLRTALQHVWATVQHDMGYKSDIDVPQEYLRKMTRLAGLLELADEEFLSFRNSVEEYRRNIISLIRDKKFDDISLDRDSFNDYMATGPFDRLNEQIASINHAEIQQVSYAAYLAAMRGMGLETLGDVERMRKDCFDDAYLLARHQIGSTDLDIIASTMGLVNLCVVYILKNGGGEPGIKKFYDCLYGNRERNINTAKRLVEQAKKINIID